VERTRKQAVTSGSEEKSCKQVDTSGNRWKLEGNMWTQEENKRKQVQTSGNNIETSGN